MILKRMEYEMNNQNNPASLITRRRRFLLSAGVATGAMVVGVDRLAAAADKANVNKVVTNTTLLEGYLHGFGIDGRFYPGYHHHKPRTISVVTSLNLANGLVRQTPIEMGNGHTAMGAGGGRILCVAQHMNKSMMLASDHKTIATFIAPEGYVYGGHGLIFPDRNIFIIPMRHTYPETVADHGQMQVYDFTSLQLLDQVDSGGLDPHEVHKIPNKDEIVTTHYGDVYIKRKPFEHNVVETKLTILDAKTLKPKRHYPQPEFNAMITHMRVDNYGWAYFVLTQYIDFDDLQAEHDNVDPLVTALSMAKDMAKTDYNFAIPRQSMIERHLAVPLPFVRVNTQTGEKQVITVGEQHHLRSQSVAYNKVTGTAIGLYYYSNNLVLHQTGKQPELITGDQLQLSEIRGVTEIPNTPYIAVCGTYEGMSVMDLNTRKVIAHYPTNNFNSTHLYHDADIA
jgi:hypothetical protein